MAEAESQVRALSQGNPSSGTEMSQAAAPVIADEALAAVAVENRSAYVELYRRHVTSVYSYFAWKFGRATADDLTSETFVRTLNTLRRFDARRNWKAWLFGIARNVASEHLRRRMQERRVGGEASEHVDESPTPEDATLDAERVTLARTLFASLNAGEQELVALRFWAGLSYREVGAVVGVSEGATRVRVHRVLQKLRRRMEASP